MNKIIRYLKDARNIGGLVIMMTAMALMLIWLLWPNEAQPIMIWYR